ncbi:MAG: hypothetical protein C5B52_00055 [Bacteroidetes bacterium]|nr:MAG: hypothetical protein C5B52_00055 [Bacteroidota bacterium]
MITNISKTIAMNKKWIPFLIQGILIGSAWSQDKKIDFNVEAQGIYTSSGTVPFWFRANQYGSIPDYGLSASLIGRIEKRFDSSTKKVFDWGFGIEDRVNLGTNTKSILTEAYGKIRFSIFQFKAGRSKDFMGLADSVLSTGTFPMSGNALGIPKVEISIPEFWSIPILGKLFAIKGNYVHGWIGTIPVKASPFVDEAYAYLHQKSLYGRIGKPQWKWKLYGGFNHQVFWGSEDKLYGDKWTLTPWQTYWYVITGKPYGTNNVARSKVGNHLGSLDLGFQYDLKSFRILAYHQFFYDVGALFHAANLADGLSGISLVNAAKSSGTFQWKRMNFEFMYSKNQAGETWSPVTPSGDEDYYNNYLYAQGWSYKETGLGTPLIENRKYIRTDHPTDPQDYFINNRVVAFHYGILGTFKEWTFLSKLTYSLNYGTYGTSEPGHSLGSHHYPPAYGLFGEVDQFSGYLEISKALKNGYRFGVAAAGDVGDLYYNSAGVILKLNKSF